MDEREDKEEGESEFYGGGIRRNGVGIEGGEGVGGGDVRGNNHVHFCSLTKV